MTEPELVLSELGCARRAAILRRLDGAMKRRNRLRAARRASVAALIIAAVPAVAWLAMPKSRAPVPRMAEAPGARIMTSLVETDHSILDRLAAPSIELRTVQISDDELQRLLASRGIPSGYIRTGGRVILAGDLRPPDDGSG